MKFAILIIFLLMLATATAYQQISGEFGQKWISDFKAKNPETQSSDLKNDLWAWGSKPHGKDILDGKLVDANLTPATIAALNWMQAMGYSNPVIMNSSNPYGSFTQNIGLVSDDPWILAQQLGRPVVANNILYYPAF
ncbi:Uncharacterised protein [uncultured archaeon]|nr:Uncharacterised protein [uncultured archaeon]